MFEREIRRKYEKDLLLRDIDIVDRFDRYKIYITYVYKTSYPAITSKNKKKTKKREKKKKKTYTRINGGLANSLPVFFFSYTHSFMIAPIFEIYASFATHPIYPISISNP